MSAPVLDRMMPMDLPAAEPGSSVSFLGIVRRRWPWVLVGIFIGIVGGLLAYTVRPAVYQSNAQVMVTKKRESLTSFDPRSAYIEDYMQSQATMIKSERVMSNAALRIKKKTEEFRTQMPSDEVELAKWLGAQFSVAREKDPTNPASMNNVLNVSMKAPSVDDSQKLLEIILDAYRAELKVVTDRGTEDRLNLLNSAIETNRKKRTDETNAQLEFSRKINETTKEIPETIQSRYSESLKSQVFLENELIEVNEYLGVIKDAGDDAAKRSILFAQISTYLRNAPISSINTPSEMNLKLQIAQQELRVSELSKKFGKDHPEMQQQKGLLDQMKSMYAKNNPGDPDGKLDGLAQIEAFLMRRKATLDKQISNHQAKKLADENMLKVILPYKDQIDVIKDRIKETDKRIDSFETDKTSTLLTRDSSGFLAEELNKPSRDPIPVQPKLTQSLLLGIAAGLLFGVGLAALAGLSEKGFRSPADIRARLGLPVLGHIPPIRTDLPVEENLDLEPTIVSALRPKSVEAEAYRGVRTALYFNAAGSTHQMIQVTSPNQGDGKSTLACNLAVSIAQSGKRTLLVDCDMRRPRVHKVFHLAEPGPGLAAVIGGNVPLSSAIQRSVIENLSILPCGKKPANPAELLTSPNFSDLLDRLKADFDYVILDTPPVLAVSDPSAVAPRADGVILVFRMTSRVRPLAERAREQLQQIGANVIGVVVNGSGRSSEGYGGYAYAYGQDYKGYTAEGGYMENYSVEEEDESPPKKG